MKNTTELNKNDEEPWGAESSANRKDSGGQKCKRKAKLNIERILQETEDFWKANNHQLDDIKDELHKPVTQWKPDC